LAKTTCGVKEVGPGKILKSDVPVLLGSAGIVQANRKWAGPGPFFIIYADNLTRLDLRKMLAFHQRYDLPLTIRFYEGAAPQRAGFVCLDEDDIVVDFEEKPAHMGNAADLSS
jgi:NDP-sugar pyrophosphorylase family protein